MTKPDRWPLPLPSGHQFLASRFGADRSFVLCSRPSGESVLLERLYGSPKLRPSLRYSSRFSVAGFDLTADGSLLVVLILRRVKPVGWDFHALALRRAARQSDRAVPLIRSAPGRFIVGLLGILAGPSRAVVAVGRQKLNGPVVYNVETVDLSDGRLSQLDRLNGFFY